MNYQTLSCGCLEVCDFDHSICSSCCKSSDNLNDDSICIECLKFASDSLLGKKSTESMFLVFDLPEKIKDEAFSWPLESYRAMWQNRGFHDEKAVLVHLPRLIKKRGIRIIINWHMTSELRYYLCDCAQCKKNLTYLPCSLDQNKSCNECPSLNLKSADSGWTCTCEQDAENNRHLDYREFNLDPTCQDYADIFA